MVKLKQNKKAAKWANEGVSTLVEMPPRLVNSTHFLDVLDGLIDLLDDFQHCCGCEKEPRCPAKDLALHACHWSHLVTKAQKDEVQI